MIFIAFFFSERNLLKYRKCCEKIPFFIALSYHSLQIKVSTVGLEDGTNGTFAILMLINCTY